MRARSARGMWIIYSHKDYPADKLVSYNSILNEAIIGVIGGTNS